MCATLTLVSLLCGDCSAKREDVERLGEWHRRTTEQIAEFVVDADDQQQDLARLSFITFFELFRQVVGHCPPRGEALHRVWLEHRSMMKRLVKDATHDQRKLRRRERKLRRTVRVDVCVCVCVCVCVWMCVCVCVCVCLTVGIVGQRRRVREGNMALMRKIALAKDRIEEMKAEVGHVRGALVSHRLNRARMCTHTFSTTTCESRLVAKRWT